MSAAESAGPRMVRECAFDALIPSGEIATKILSHLKLPLTAEGFLPIRAPPWGKDFGWLAANDEVDRPFFDRQA